MGRGAAVHREYNETRFEWQIYDVKDLAQHVSASTPGNGSRTSSVDPEHPEAIPEALRRGVIIGEGWYKLEIGMSG
jgi:hypothetical protein